MSLKIIKAGLLDTIQDLGRHGYQNLGINPSGAMDRFSASLANALLGKELNSPVIELHFPASQIQVKKPAIICLAGADFSPTINGIGIPLHQPVSIPADSVLQLQRLKNGSRSYLALLNELEISSWLNSCSTNLKAGVGGWQGRQLMKDDELPFDSLAVSHSYETLTLPWQYKIPFDDSEVIECLPGNEWSWLSPESQTTFSNHSFLITTFSDRMGFRLQGPLLQTSCQENLLSSAVSFGTVQLLPNGQTIVLMADHQTTGGYPRIAHVISADLPKLAQLMVGQSFQFAFTTLEAAQERLVAQQQFLKQLQKTCNLKMQNWLHAH